MSTPNQPQSTPSAAQILAALSPPAGNPTAPAYYGMVVLGFAAQAYTQQGAAWSTIQSGLMTAITNTQFTPALPSPLVALSQGATVAGTWSLDWGPANGPNGDGGDESNLVYIASYRALAGNPNYAAGAPMFFVVGIRGTDTADKLIPLLQQLAQDVRDFKPLPWSGVLNSGSVPTPNTTTPATLPGNIANGTSLGFIKIASSMALLNGDSAIAKKNTGLLSVAEALKALMPAGSAVPIVVTGHSLGACQTQVMASYLAWQFPQNTVIPYSYAPPTAGDSDFINGYSNQCPAGQFWFNEYDVVPYAFLGVPGSQTGLAFAAQHLWASYRWPQGSILVGSNTDYSGQPAPPLPSAMVDAISLLGPDIPTVYARPGNGVFGLAGAIPSPQVIAMLLQSMGGSLGSQSAVGGLAQLVWQHFPPCYRNLMLAQYGSQLAPFKFAAYPVAPPV